MRDIGPLEIGLIVVAIVLMFGVGRLGQLGGALGKSMREFRRERDRKDDPPAESTGEARGKGLDGPVQGDPAGRQHCPGCGGSTSANARFCMECGARIKSRALKPW